MGSVVINQEGLKAISFDDDAWAALPVGGSIYSGAPVAQKYDDTLLPFMAMMRKELHANSHKGDREGWLKMDVGRATHEIYHHYEKLENAAGARDYPQIAEYCADIANCAMMVVDVCGLLKNNQE